MAILSAAGVTACGAVLGITELGTDAVDGGSRIEGGAGDGSGVGDVTGGAWCEANAKGASFCEDFGGSSLSAQWTIEASGWGGEGTLDPDVFTSPPAAFTATVLPPSDVGYAQWCLRRTFAGTYGTVRVAFDVRIDTLEANPSANVTFAELVVTSSGPDRRYALKLALRADGVHLLEELSTGSGADHLLRYTPTPGVWARMEMNLESTSGTGGARTASVKIDGDTMLDRLPVTDPSASGSPLLRLGAVYATGPSATRVVHVDDVVVDVR